MHNRLLSKRTCETNKSQKSIGKPKTFPIPLPEILTQCFPYENSLIFSNTLISSSKSISFRSSRTLTKSLQSVDELIKAHSILKSNQGFYSVDHHKVQLKALRKIPISLPDPKILRKKSVFLERIPGKEQKKTLIFDLDETLVHCCDKAKSNKISITMHLKSGGRLKSGLLIRPYAYECLEKASQLFEVIIFAGSSKEYADRVIDYLDPHRKLVDYRLFKDSCIEVNGGPVKDLRIFLNRKAKDLIIIDDSPFNFLNQLENGVPITSWLGDFSDKNLLFVMDYMEKLVKAPDVRILNRLTFA